MTTSCEMDSGLMLLLTDKEFKEFGTMTEEMERGRRFSSEEIESSAGGTSVNVDCIERSVQEVQGTQKNNRNTREEGYRIPSQTAEEEEEEIAISVLSAATDKFPDVGQCNRRIPPASMLSTSHQEVHFVRPDATAAATVTDTTRISNKTEEVGVSQGRKESKNCHQRIGEQKPSRRGDMMVDVEQAGEGEHVCKSRNIKYCQGKEIGYWDMSSRQQHQHSSTGGDGQGVGRGKPARNDDMNRNAARQCDDDRRHQKHDRPEQYCNTCSHSCQFCPTASEATGNVIAGATLPPPPVAAGRTTTYQGKNNIVRGTI